MHAPEKHRCCASCEQEFALASSADARLARRASITAGASLATALVLALLHRVVDAREHGPFLWLAVVSFGIAVVSAGLSLRTRWRTRASFFAR